MYGRDLKIYEEAAALWRSVRHTPPPSGYDGPGLLMLLLQALDPGPYDRLADANRRAKQIAWPNASRPSPQERGIRR
jgi:hypothetical protein